MQRQDSDSKALKTALADQDDAVFSLLESLLQEVEDIPDIETETQVEVETRTATETLEVKISEPLPLEQETVTEEVVAEELDDSGSLPEWSAEPFSCLLFDVEGTEVAVPLVVLNSIAVWNEEALSIPTQPDWHLGVLKHRDENVVIVDTARLIMPENVQQTPEQRRVEHGSHFIVINDRWALSCNGIKETIQLSPEQVRWRPKRPTRPWAVGTLIERLCVLLDTEQLLKEIA